MNKAKQIKDSLDLKTVMKDYGVDFNSKGFCRCFMHHEKTASMAIKNQHYKCFGCGAYGDVISFVENYCNVDFKTALVRLDTNYHLGIISHKMTHRERLQAKEDKRFNEMIESWHRAILSNYRRIANLHRILYRQLCKGAKIDGLEEFVDQLSTALDDFTGKEARRWMN